MRVVILFLLVVLQSWSVAFATPDQRDSARYRSIMLRASDDRAFYLSVKKGSTLVDDRTYIDIQSIDKKYKWRSVRLQGILLSIDSSNPKETVFRVSINESKQYDLLGLSVAFSGVQVGDRVDVLGFISPGLLPGRDRRGKILMLPFVVAAKLLPADSQSETRPSMPSIAAKSRPPAQPIAPVSEVTQSPSASPDGSKGRMVCTPRRTGGEACEYVPGKDEHSIGASD